MITVFSSLADQGAPLDWAKEATLCTRKVDLESLTVVNKGASAVVIQLWNLPFSPTAGRTTTVDGTTGIATLASHKLNDGDNVTISDGTHTATGYVRRLTPNTFQLFDTRAHAQATDSLTGLQSLATIAGTINTTWNSGVAVDGTGAEVALVPEEFSILGSGSAPSNQLSYTGSKFTRGLHAKGVTALGGSTLISATDLKFTPRYRYASGAAEL